MKKRERRKKMKRILHRSEQRADDVWDRFIAALPVRPKRPTPGSRLLTLEADRRELAGETLFPD
jgi:hypothetical protein